MTRRDPTAIPSDRLTWTAGVVIGASLPHWPQLPPWIPLLLLACIAWRFAAKLSSWPLPPTWLRLVFAFFAFVGVLLEYSTINGVNAGSALLVVMVALKFFECNTQRDQLVLMIIAYFLVFASLLYGGGLLMGLYLLAFVWITTVGLLQLGRGGKLLPGWPTVKYSARLLLQASPIMIALFLLFPRLPAPLWGIPGNSSQGTAGLTDEMSPGDITDLGLSDEIAFRVQFLSDVPNSADLYWRGPVLSNFNGRTWSREQGMRRRVSDTIEYRGNASDYRVMLDRVQNAWLFALDMPRSWDSGRRLNSIVMGSDYQLRMFAFDQIAGSIEYSVESFTDYRALEPMTERDRARYTRLPEDRNPRTQAMVQSWLREDPSPDTIIDRALDIFRGEEFFYTLTPPGLGTHSADEFIFETREGFCEHYASAFAIMLRAAGIPTRVVTGYQGGELNPLGQYYIVRQSDAHAWTEVWREQSGWQRVDPITAVAPERIALGSIRGAAAVGATAGAALGSMRLLRQAMLAWDTVSTYWNRWVIGYSPQIQRNLLEWFGFERPRMAELLSSALISTLVLMIALSGWLTLRFRRTRRRDAPAESFALLMRRLQRHRIAPLAPGESPTAYARRAAERLPAAARTIERIVADYLLARYEPDPDRAALGRLTDGVRHFRPHGAPASP